jgi:hypothetical protein
MDGGDFPSSVTNLKSRLCSTTHTIPVEIMGQSPSRPEAMASQAVTIRKYTICYPREYLCLAADTPAAPNGVAVEKPKVGLRRRAPRHEDHLDQSRMR